MLNKTVMSYDITIILSSKIICDFLRVKNTILTSHFKSNIILIISKINLILMKYILVLYIRMCRPVSHTFDEYVLENTRKQNRLK